MADITYRAVWQAADTRTQVEAMKFWADNGLLRRGVDPAARAAGLCVLAYDDGDVAGLSTVQIRPLALLHRRFAMFRCAVAPAHRRRGVATELAVRSRQALEAWALANPERQVEGMACVVRGAELAAKQAQPLWPRSGLGLVGYDGAGAQIRIAWFDHIVV